MKLYEFLRLNDEQQYQAVWEKSVHTHTVMHDGLICQLYAIDAFYIEIRYSQENNKIIKMTPFKEGELLEKYLKELPDI